MTDRNPLPPPAVAEGKLQGFDLSGRRVIVYGAEKPAASAAVEALREAGALVGVTSAGTDGTSLFRLKKAAAGGPAEAVDLANGTNVQVASICPAATSASLYATEPQGTTSNGASA